LEVQEREHLHGGEARKTHQRDYQFPYVICSADPNSLPPRGDRPPRAPSQQPKRRTHSAFLHRPTLFSTQQAEGRPGSHAVGEVRRHAQEAPRSRRLAFQEPNFVQAVHYLHRSGLEDEP
jgi:hypothetical protein